MRISTDNQRRLVLGLIGLTTIMAGLFTWRGGQLASSAAFDDRQSVGQTITQSQQDIQVGLGAVTDASSYVRYVADYAEANAIDDQAAELFEQGRAAGLATLNTEQASALRTAASARAATAGVFGRLALYVDLASPSAQPRPFDLKEHFEALETEAKTGIRSPGQLDPDFWATEADATRTRTYQLRITALVLIIAVFVLTISQITEKTALRLGTGAAGLVILVGMSAIAFAKFF